MTSLEYVANNRPVEATEPPTTAWLTLTVTTWPPSTSPTIQVDAFTCPGAKVEGSTVLNIGGTTKYVTAPFTSVPTLGSTIYSCGYLISDVRPALTTSTSIASSTTTSSHTTELSSHSTGSAIHSPAAHHATPTKTNVGAIAGAAAGATILGLVVGALICFLCMSSKKRKRRDSLNGNEATAMTTFLPPAAPPKERLSSRESVRNDAALLASSGGGGGRHDGNGSGDINNVLSSIGIPEGASDEEIKSELSALGYLLQEHVQNNYHLDHLDGNRNEVFRMSQALSDPAFGLDDRSHALILKLSKDPQTRFAAIHHFLALTIFSALDLHRIRSHPGSVSLLPRQVTSFLESIPLAQGVGKNGTSPQSEYLDSFCFPRKPASLPPSIFHEPRDTN